MNELRIESVRCFREEQRIPIRPVTLLVGENSTGKSTILAMVRAAWDVAFGTADPDFNEQPFDLGGFDAIAHYHGGQGKRDHQFRLHASFTIEPFPGSRERREERSVEATFSERAGQPAMTSWRARQGDLDLDIDARNRSATRVTIRRKGGITFEAQFKIERRRAAHLAFDAFLGAQAQTFESSGKDAEARLSQFTSDLFRLIPQGVMNAPGRPFAGAPIRSRPERTYDPKRGLQEPEGSHVPMEIATLHATDPGSYAGLAADMAEYGRDANLFSKLGVKRLGGKAGDPFQLLVAVDKFPFNVRDVGYGVSQMLPILVDTLRGPNGQMFLLQQPEVHLHPRAQAALGSLLVRQAARRKQTFVVETHSDYLVDRVRAEIRERAGSKSFSCDDVIILYFTRVGGKAKVHPIRIDEQGNLVKPPKGYRQFFMDEERRFLGIGE